MRRKMVRIWRSIIAWAKHPFRQAIKTIYRHHILPTFWLTFLNLIIVAAIFGPLSKFATWVYQKCGVPVLPFDLIIFVGLALIFIVLMVLSFVSLIEGLIAWSSRIVWLWIYKFKHKKRHQIKKRLRWQEQLKETDQRREAVLKRYQKK